MAMIDGPAPLAPDPMAPPPPDPMMGGIAGGPFDGQSNMRREEGEIPEARLALVKQKQADVRSAKEYWSKDFKRMVQDMNFLLGRQWEGVPFDDDDLYVANLTLRHVSLRVSSIYAKNPTVVAKKRDQMDFKIWDETPESVQQALMLMQTAAQNPEAAAADPNTAGAVAQSQALMLDIQTGMARRTMLTKVSRTMELYFKNRVLTNQFPPFKTSVKQLVRRVEACGVGYVQLDFMREMERSPDTAERITTITEQIATMERIMADMKDGNPKLDETSAECEQLRMMLGQLHSQPDVITQEGIVYDFPSSTSLIPDPKLTHLPGWVGADWVAREYLLSPDDIKEIWKVDVGTSYTAFCPGNEHWASYVEAGRNRDSTNGRYKKKGLCCVWRMYSRRDGLVYTMVDGYKDFLEEPGPPRIKLERFYPWFALAFNVIEHPTNVFPISDVRLLRHQQREYNRSRQGLREHRWANRPLMAMQTGILDEDDKKLLEERPPNAVIELNGLAPNTKIGDVLQAVQGPPITAELYDVAPIYEDIQRTVGDQEANLGGTSGATATESSIAEGSRISSLQSNIDDLDDFLSDLMKYSGQVALREIGREEIARFVGPGAVWPELSGQDIADEIVLEIVAGSSGRPNRAAEIQNFTQMMPFLMQIPGINPAFLARQALMRLDDKLDLTEAITAGQLSIQALNSQAGKPMGQPATGEKDSNAQGEAGASNAEKGAEAGGGLGPQQPNDLALAGQPQGTA